MADGKEDRMYDGMIISKIEDSSSEPALDEYCSTEVTPDHTESAMFQGCFPDIYFVKCFVDDNLCASDGLIFAPER